MTSAVHNKEEEVAGIGDDRLLSNNMRMPYAVHVCLTSVITPKVRLAVDTVTQACCLADVRPSKATAAIKEN